MTLTEKYKLVANRGLKAIANPFTPNDVRSLVGDLVGLLGDMVYKIERLEGKQQEEIKDHGSL